MSDDQIQRRKILNVTPKDDIEHLLTSCNDKQLYDVILDDNYLYENLGDVMIRFLDIKAYGGQVELFHPGCLVSAALYQTTVNLRQCANLQNLLSKWNVYYPDDIRPLTSLRKFSSYDDIYENVGSCMLEDLFKNNRLEYVFVMLYHDGHNTIGHMQLRHNIKRLRCFSASTRVGRFDILLDVTEEYPDNLQVYSVKYDFTKYSGTIIGLEHQVKQLKGQFVHHYQYTDM